MELATMATISHGLEAKFMVLLTKEQRGDLCCPHSSVAHNSEGMYHSQSHNYFLDSYLLLSPLPFPASLPSSFLDYRQDSSPLNTTQHLTDEQVLTQLLQWEVGRSDGTSMMKVKYGVWFHSYIYIWYL